MVDLLLGIDVGETLRVLQVEHGQRDQGVAFAGGEGLLEQALGLVALGLAAVGLGHQQTAEAGLGAGRGAGGGAVGGLGLPELGRVTGFDLDIGQAYLGLAVAQVGELLVVALGQGGVAALEGFVGQALVGQAGATGQADGQGQCTHR